MKQKDDFLKKVVITLGIFLLVFTIAVFIVFCVTGGSEPSTLIACVFGACLGECSICGLIKKKNDKKQNIEDDSEIAG